MARPAAGGKAHDGSSRGRVGLFKESDDVGRSLAQDRQQKAKTEVKPGQGDRGDQRAAKAERRDETRRKLIEFDTETFHALDVLARDRMMTIQELADEAFRDLLRKHGRPVELVDALKRSAGKLQPNEPKPPRL